MDVDREFSILSDCRRGSVPFTDNCIQFRIYPYRRHLVRPLAIFSILAIVLIGLSSLALRSLQRGGWMTALCVLVLVYGGLPVTYGSNFLKTFPGLDIQGGTLIIALLVVACIAGIQLRQS